MSFSNENNHKTDLKFCAPWLVHEENFEVHRFASYTRKHLQIRIVLNNCVKNHLKTNYVKFRIHYEKDHLCFYKISTNQTLTFISSKLVYFRSVSYIKYSTLKKRTALPLMFCIITRQLSLQ